MEVVRTRHERAHDETPTLERLVHGGRLVELTDDRLEVADVERVGIDAAVPSDHVERMVRVRQPREPGAMTHDYVDVVAFPLHELGWTAQVALAVGRTLDELAVPRQILRRRLDVRG